jgi:DNA-binding NarL/FixJ family response regulator
MAQSEPSGDDALEPSESLGSNNVLSVESAPNTFGQAQARVIQEGRGWTLETPTPVSATHSAVQLVEGSREDDREALLASKSDVHDEFGDTVLRTAEQGAKSQRLTVLSERELTVAVLVAGGRSNREIAEELVISRKTAEAHVSHILTKLGFWRRVQIATWAMQHCAGAAHG